MPLINAYVLPTNRVADIFKKIQDGQAPERVTVQLLKDWGFTSTNDRAFIQLLKGLGFLNADGKPTSKYLDYRDHSRSKQILGQAIREAYADIFLIKEHPSSSDKSAVEGKFKSYHNVSDNVASQMTKTFTHCCHWQIYRQSRQRRRNPILWCGTQTVRGSRITKSITAIK
jgi:hypothetical protein